MSRWLAIALAFSFAAGNLHDGAPTGEYQDFVTGFVVDDDRVGGRPVGVAVAADGALLVSDDASNTLWRVTPVK
jgi:glucose/arabinose dehydrogenase